jgi:hypothetical protein
MKPIIKIPLIILSIIIFYLLVNHFTASIEDGQCNKCLDFNLNVAFKGVVTRKEIDRQNHSYPMVHIQQLESDSQVTLNLNLDTSNFFQEIKSNDTISKDFNSSWIYIKKNGAYIKYKWIDFGCEKPSN